jgi:NRPS condensation-like uncharacterized protein
MLICMRMQRVNMQQPATIAFNSIDRSYLIPEAADSDTHLPMSIITVLELQNAPQVEDVVRALQLLAQHFPQLRLGYRLQPEKSRWMRVPDAELMGYLASCVTSVAAQSIEALISQMIAVNNEPLSQPLAIVLCDKYFIIRMHHSFGDGRFFYLLNRYLLTALFAENRLSTLPAPSGWRYPLWRLVWRNVGTARQVFWQWLRALSGAVDEFQQQVAVTSNSQERTPIVSGLPQCIALRQIPPDSFAIIQKIRDKLSTKKRVSLNTLLQVLIGERLAELSLLKLPTTYSIPVDLHRYLPQPDAIYPGNLATQIRIVLPDLASWIEACYLLQERVDKQLDTYMPLVSIPNDWLLGLGGNKTYKVVNRDWLLKSTNTDSRFFILTNLGNLDSNLGDFAAEIKKPQVVTPLMGGPPLVISLNTYQSQGNFAITYDPRVLSQAQIDLLCALFTPEWLTQKLAAL